MDSLADQAGEVLEIASAGNSDDSFAIVVDRRGGLSVVVSAGWSLGGLHAEFAARRVFRVERRNDWVRVEGYDGLSRCLLERPLPLRGRNVLVPTRPYAALSRSSIVC